VREGVVPGARPAVAADIALHKSIGGEILSCCRKTT